MSWLDALGWAGSALLVYSLLQTRVLRFRVLNLLASGVLTAFNAFLEIWPMVAMNAILCAINVWHIGRLVRHRHDETTYSVLEIRPDDTYLRHVLRIHAKDIARTQPDFSPAVLTDDRRAYLVLNGDETVGVVVLHAEDDGVARVDLDWVSPRFRDFSPGEFVWRRSGLLRDAGFTRVISPRRMVGAYYERIGFRREGDVYVLDLATTAR